MEGVPCPLRERVDGRAHEVSSSEADWVAARPPSIVDRAEVGRQAGIKLQGLADAGAILRPRGVDQGLRVPAERVALLVLIGPLDPRLVPGGFLEGPPAS